MLKVFLRIGFLTIISFLVSEVALSQKSKIESITLTIGENSLKGAAVKIDFSKEEIFKAWWKYSKGFSRTQTQKDRIMHTIPAVDGESTESVIFYSRVEKVNKNSSKLSAALDDDGMSNGSVTKYQGQIKKLLIDFRLNYYTNNLQQKITETEKEAARVSRNLDKQITQGYKLQQELRKLETKPTDKQILNDLKNNLKSNQQQQDSVSLQLQGIQKIIEGYKKTMANVN
ncbi:MAG: hypothetical protein O2887_01765 [Bacteroidetes bacterium]|nr:hypothetical protein [Bacteroidota bacterium]MDA1119216.1 hypothetical protein [Bacteroidota bacterium]